MELRGTLLANGAIDVVVTDNGKSDRMRFQNLQQMKELSELLANEVKRIGKLVPKPKPRYVEKPLFG